MEGFFLGLYAEAIQNPGVVYPSLWPKWERFQEAFQAAAEKLLEAKECLPPKEELPRLGPTGLVFIYYGVMSWEELFQRHGEFFRSWLPGVMEARNLGDWFWRTDFDRKGMEQFGFLIEDVKDAVERYREYLRKQEAKRLAERLSCLEASPKPASEGASALGPSASGQPGPEAQQAQEAPAASEAQKQPARSETWDRVVSFFIELAPEKITNIVQVIDTAPTADVCLTRLEELGINLRSFTADRIAELIGRDSSTVRKTDWWKRRQD